MYNNSVSYYTLIYPNFILLYATVSELYPIRTILLCRSVSYVTYCMLVSYSPVVRKNRAGPNSVKTDISFDMFCLALAN